MTLSPLCGVRAISESSVRHYVGIMAYLADNGLGLDTRNMVITSLAGRTTLFSEPWIINASETYVTS